ncbi:helix-turn-helix domain-containing protein [Evtepia sp.]|uniref:helix-turn-helix domain-containing protein n=1 Tax=Evtepia sp. TaxID=2773933 RepID=UPI0039C72F33
MIYQRVSTKLFNFPVPYAERKKGQHPQREERDAIQHLKRQGYSNRAIAREIGYARLTGL